MSSRSWSLRVWITRSPTRRACPGDRRSVWVQARAQRGVERIDADRALVHRGEHEDVGDRIEVVVGGQALGRQRDDLVEHLLGVVVRDHEEVADVVGSGVDRRRDAAR